MITHFQRKSVQGMTTDKRPSVDLFNKQYRKRVRELEADRSGLSFFHSMFLTPDQMELSQPLSGLNGRYIDAINIAFYFEKSLSTVSAELTNGSEEAE